MKKGILKVKNDKGKSVDWCEKISEIEKKQEM